MALNTEIVSTTLRNRTKEISDAIFNTGLLAKMLQGKAGGVERIRGGSNIRRAVEFAKNATTAWFSGTDVLDTTKQTIITSVDYEWRYLAGTYMITIEEMQKNAGEHQVISMLRARERNLIKSMVDAMETALFAAQPAAGAKDQESLLELVDVDPTGNPPRGAVGGVTVASAANTWWRNRTVPLHVDTARAVGDSYDFASNGLTYMRRMFNACARTAGTDHPDLIVATVELYEAYEAGMPPQLVLTSKDKRLADLGFTGFQFKGASLTYSNQLTGGTGTTLNKMYFLNTDYLHYILDAEWDMDMGPLQRPTDQAVLTAQVVSAMNLVCTDRNKQGVIEGFLV